MQLLLICFTLILASVQVSSYTTYDTLSQDEKDCLKELNYANNVLDGAFDMANKIVVNKKEVQDFMACGWRKSNLFTEKYEPNIPALESNLAYSARKVLDYEGEQNRKFCQEAVQGCLEETGTPDSPGDQAIKMHNCFVKRIVYGPH